MKNKNLLIENIVRKVIHEAIEDKDNLVQIWYECTVFDGGASQGRELIEFLKKHNIPYKLEKDNYNILWPVKIMVDSRIADELSTNDSRIVIKR